MGQAAPNIKSVNEGRVALATVLSVIRRKSPIVLDDKTAQSFDPKVSGNIVFEGVSF
jgi:enoyl reductase-like protein